MPADGSEAELGPDEVLDILRQAQTKVRKPWLQAALLECTAVVTKAYAARLARSERKRQPAADELAAEATEVRT